MFLRTWRLLAWLATVLLEAVLIAGLATAQTRDPQARDTGSVVAPVAAPPLPVPQLFGVDERTFLIFAAAIGSLGFLGVAWLVRLWRRDRMRLQYELESMRFRLERQAAAVQEPRELTEGALAGGPAYPPVVSPEVPNALIDAINRGECTLFWGGGLSAQAGYPTWREGLAKMIEGVEADTPFEADLQSALKAGRFSLVVDSLATRLNRNEIIRQLVALWGSPRPVVPAIDAVSKLPFTNAVTSVWDPLIEQAFARRNPVVVMGVSSESLERLLTREAFCIVRLWGALTRQDSVLFTPNEYRTAVAGNPTFAKYVASLTLSQSHFFVGASLETIEEYLSATPRGTSSHTHYALVPESEGIELAREVFKKRRVELLVFRPTPSWPEIPSFLTKLAQAVEVRAPAVPTGRIETILLKKIELENIGPFKSLSLDLDPNWNVLLGDNGAGKSTVLRAIALVVCGDDSRALIEGGRLLRSDSEQGFVQLTVGSNIYRTELVRDSSGAVHVNVGTRVAPLKAGRWVILAFPPLRGVSGENPKGPTTEGSPFPVIQDVLPILVGPVDSRLSSLKQWLVNLDVRSKPGDGVSSTDANENQKLRDHFFRVINAFVPGTDVEFGGVDRKTWQVNITSHGAKIGIEQLSQGTNSILGWVGALLQRIYEIHGYDNDNKSPSAVVLIDEIDAHLHPDWQQRIVGALSAQFPAVQFIATAHSPLIVGELEQHQVYRMVRQPSGEVAATYPTHPFKGLGVAGLLTSDMFGLASTVDQKTQTLLEEQRTLSAKEKLTDADRIKLEELNAQLDEFGFSQQVRDPEYTKYLQEKERLVKQGLGPLERIKGEPPPSVREMIREAVARATQNEKS
jgi:energy-coupling factor transporter ATP-binding protein EcfA2